jgi:RHS repeat-associated protein
MKRYESATDNQTFNNTFPRHAVKNTGYVYDLNDNMTKRPANSGLQTLGWDAENHLTSLTSAALNESYLYDPDGQRVKKVAAGASTYYINQYFEVDATSSHIRYYYFGGQRVAMRRAAVLTYLHADHLGSPVVTTASGVNATQTYLAYGKVRNYTGSFPSRYQFTGQYKDDSGLQYFNARYYDPQLGTFISPDTLVPDATNVFDYNRFMYVRGRVMNYNDPSGHGPGPSPCGPRACTQPTPEEQQAQLDAIQLTLDAVGVADPTPISDGTNAVISVARGNYKDAVLSAIAIIPFLGDLAKGAKYADEAAVALKYGDEAVEIAAKLADPKTIRFSQDSINANFKDGSSVDDLINNLKSGQISADDIPAIRIFEREGQTYTLDNRRLYAFQQAGVEIKTVQATAEEVTREGWKLTTKNNGTSIVVRRKQ